MCFGIFYDYLWKNRNQLKRDHAGNGTQVYSVIGMNADHYTIAAFVIVSIS